MAYSPSKVLAKPKSTGKKGDKDDKGKRHSAMLDFISKHKKASKHDVGKHNNGTTTGFKAVEKKASKEYHSKAAGERVAGAIYAHMEGKR